MLVVEDKYTSFHVCDGCQEITRLDHLYDIDGGEYCRDCAFKMIYSEDLGCGFFDSVDDEEIMSVLNMTREQAAEYDPSDLCYERFDEFFDFWRNKK